MRAGLRPGWIAAALLSSLVAAACTAPERSVTSQPPLGATTTAPVPSSLSPPASPSPIPTPPASAARLPGSLLVRTPGAGLAVVRPDGTQGTEIVHGQPGRLEVVAAAWAPDGSRIAWSQVSAEPGTSPSSVVWSQPDGSGRSDALLSFMAIYLSWDPTASRVAFLGGENEFTLSVMERAEGETAGRPLAHGAPFYFSWAPEGDRMLTHVANTRLDTLTMDGVRRVVEPMTGVFQAPIWTADGSRLLYVSAEERLVARDLATDEVRDLARLDGGAYLVASPDGSRVAYHARGPDEMDFYGEDLAETATDLGVHVVDVRGGRAITVTEAPAMAWSWSPDGSHLAIFEPVYTGDGVRFRWVVWDGRRTFADRALRVHRALAERGVVLHPVRPELIDVVAGRRGVRVRGGAPRRHAPDLGAAGGAGSGGLPGDAGRHGRLGPRGLITRRTRFAVSSRPRRTGPDRSPPRSR